MLLETLFQSNYMYTLFGYAYSSIIAIFKVSKFSMKFDGLIIDKKIIQYVFYIVVLISILQRKLTNQKIFG